jgi:hypothetical protein
VTLMIKRCEDPHNRRRHHVGQLHPAPATPAPPVDQPAEPPPGNAHRAQDRPGSVGAAVLSAARLSAKADCVTVASAMGVTEDSLRECERGVKSLALVPFPLIEKLQMALHDLGAEPSLVADIEAAIWCDLVIDAIAGGEDTSCLMADPLAGQAAFSELLAWSLAGITPARYRPYTQPGSLINGPL